MSVAKLVSIDINEAFPHLSQAPIVEAVIDIRARASRAWEESAVRSQLQPQLQGQYELLDSQRELEHETTMERGTLPRQAARDLGWKGLRFRSGDARQVARFNRDGFVMSRLEPYVNWAQLEGEALRLWRIFVGIADPLSIQRVGVRFVNRIKLPQGELRFEEYIQPAPAPPHDLHLPFASFLHRDLLAVPGHPYAVSVVRTVQRPVGGDVLGISLIIDIDVFTTQESALDDSVLLARLQEMRWVKNKVFFGSLTDRALEAYQ
ncbi:MAG: TIGR04255 family protein [Acidobacteriota bacterium]